MGIIHKRYENAAETERVGPDDRVLSEYSVMERTIDRSVCTDNVVQNICQRNGKVKPKPQSRTKASAVYDRRRSS